MRTRGDSGGFLPLTTLCRGVTRSFSRKVIYFIIVLCIMCRWIYSSYLQNYLMASPQYITSHMADDYLLAQLYRDHSIDTPVVLETSGLVSGFGFEGYTWHKNWTNNEIELVDQLGKTKNGGLDSFIKPTVGSMLFVNCVYELHWPLRFGRSQQYAAANETTSGAITLLVRLSPNGMLHRSIDNVIVGQWLGCIDAPLQGYYPEYGSRVTLSLEPNVLDDMGDASPHLVEDNEMDQGSTKNTINHNSSRSSPVIIQLDSRDLGITWTMDEEKKKGDSSLEMRLLMPEEATVISMTSHIAEFISYLNHDAGDNRVAKPPSGVHTSRFGVKVYEVVAKEGTHVPFVFLLTEPLRDLRYPERVGDDTFKCEYRVENVEHLIIQRGSFLSMTLVMCSTYGLDIYLGRKMEVRVIWDKEAVNQYVEFKHIRPPPFSGLWMSTKGSTVDTQIDDRRWSPFYRLATCTIIRDEGRNLEEWLEYHNTLGVEQFYIYDNTPEGENDELQSTILRNWTDMGRVTVKHWPNPSTQTEALNDCMQSNRHVVDWMAFIDVDEFIDPTPAAPVSEIRTWEHMKEKLKQPNIPGMNTYPGLHCVPWVYYCAKDMIEEPEPRKGNRETYQDIVDKSGETIFQHEEKPIFRPIDTISIILIGPHFLYFTNENILGQHECRCPKPWRDINDIHIRHYRTKSRNEFIERRKGGDVAFTTVRYDIKGLENDWDDKNARCIHPHHPLKERQPLGVNPTRSRVTKLWNNVVGSKRDHPIL